MEKQIKVAMIPDDTRIVLNAGYQDSSEISEGREIEIIESGVKIIDPDTNNVIGSYDLVKERLEITTAYATYSIARKIVEEKRPSFITSISPLLEDRTSYSAKKINVSDEDNLKLKIENKVIKIGDLVKLI